MAKAAEEYLKRPYARILIPETGKFTAEILEFPGCFAYGDTPEEALQHLERSAESWIEAALEQGQEIPEPYSSVGFSGNFALRMPRGLHRRAARLAERDRVSLNQYLVAAVAERVGAEDALRRLAEYLERSITTIATVVRVENTQTFLLPGSPLEMVLFESGRGIIGSLGPKPPKAIVKGGSNG